MEWLLTALVAVNGAVYQGEMTTDDCHEAIKQVKEQVATEFDVTEGDDLQISFTCVLLVEV